MTLPLVLLNRRRIGGFNPRAIIAGSTAMVWLDPSDLTTMFQDAAGTTPVTAPAQPVGLVLDKSQGLALGPELVTNGDFSGGSTGWSAIGGGSIAAVSGEIQVTGGGSFSGARQSVNVTAGRSYLVTFSARRGTTTQNLSVAFGTGSVTITASSVTAQTFLVSAASSPLNLNLTIADAAASGTAFFDNISVRELPGFHATQSTAASRPTYGVVPSRGRVNLLTYTEQFDNAAGWTNFNATLSANNSVAPDGTLTADLTVPNNTNSNSHGVYPQNIFLNNSTVYTLTVYAKSAGYNFLNLFFGGVTANNGAVFNLSSGVVGSKGASVTSSAISFVGNGWYRCAVTITTNKIENEVRIYSGNADFGNGQVSSFSGDGTSGIRIWGAQLELGSTATPYQRVVSQFDVTDPAGFPSYPLHYLFFGGDLDPRWLQTSTITPSADKVQVFAGVRKLSDAAQGIVVEHSATISNAGAFNLQAPGPSGQSYRFASRGSAAASTADASSFAAPISSVLAGLGDISGDLATLRTNGVQSGQSTADQGTGNFLAYPLYIGRRGGTSLAFNGNLYGLIVRFSTANLDASLINQTERWLAQKTGVTI